MSVPASEFRLAPGHRHLNHGSFGARLHATESSRADMLAAIEANPRDGELRYARGLLRKQLGRHDEAVEDYEAFRAALEETGS